MAHMTVENISNGGPLFRVGSESSDRTYSVDVEKSTCTCTNWAIQRNKLVGAAERAGKRGVITYKCKHIHEVELVEGNYAPTAKPAVRKTRDSKAEAMKRADEIVAKFTQPTTPTADKIAALAAKAKKKGG